MLWRQPQERRGRRVSFAELTELPATLRWGRNKDDVMQLPPAAASHGRETDSPIIFHD